MKNILSLLLIFVSVMGLAQSTTASYAKKNLNVTLDLGWDSSHYGNVQWQKSTDNGVTWTNISGAISATYVFKITTGALYRAVVNGDEACDPFYIERDIKVVDFSVNLLSNAATTAEFEVTNLDMAGADVTEYGYCINYSTLSRPYASMKRVKLGDALPDPSTFTFECSDMLPNQSYSVRAYIVTSDGSLIFGPGKLVNTIEGLKWSTEDWIIKKDKIAAKFEIAGYTSDANPGVQFWFGTDESNLTQYNVTKGAGYDYTSATISLLSPNTEYIAVAKATIDGEPMEIRKTVKTLPDYSDVVVDETVGKVAHTIRWDSKKVLTQLSPDGLQVEYPRMCRVDDKTILLAYHGGSGSDHWVNIYLSKSTDNGATWSSPVTLLDKSSSFGSHYWRLADPEMTRLANGWIVMSFIGNGNPETNDNCHVMVMISKDGGDTWGDPIIVGRGRTWEPQIVQLPNGELELLVSSEAKWYGVQSDLYQEILVSRSTDNGETWTEFTRASYSPARRDGMPVAVVMQGNKGLLFSIEVINSNGYPSPSIVHRNLADEWDTAEWNGVYTDKRWGGTISGGGAPYCIQLPTGEIVISAHAGGSGVWQTGRPQIMVGDNTGHNFLNPVTPLSGTNPLPANTGAYYNSMFLKDSETVWLLMTKAQYTGNNRDNSAIIYLEGKIVERNI